MKKWEYIGGRQWSLVDDTSEFKDTVCTVEIEKSKVPIVGYLAAKLTSEELQELLVIIHKEIT